MSHELKNVIEESIDIPGQYLLNPCSKCGCSNISLNLGEPDSTFYAKCEYCKNKTEELYYEREVEREWNKANPKK